MAVGRVADRAVVMVRDDLGADDRLVVLVVPTCEARARAPAERRRAAERESMVVVLVILSVGSV